MSISKNKFISIVFIAVLTGALLAFAASSLAITLPPWLDQFFGGNQQQTSTSTATTPTPSTPPYNPPPTDVHESRIINAVRMSSPAVVSVIATKDLPVLERVFTNPFPNDPFFQQFFGEGFGVPQYRQKGTQKQEVSSGSGFFVSTDGYVLTNKHVVADTDAEYTVILNDGRKLSAKVLARHPSLDLAVLKIDGSKFAFLEPGDSDRIQTGQSVIAIGNALGEFSNTVSVGVISGLSRTVTASGGGTVETIEGVIQTDAAINPGNSGGPLLNLDGKVIGINTAMASGAQNIGFAIPINQAKKAIADVRSTGRIVIPFLGVRYVIVTPALKEQEKLPVDYGVLVIAGDNPLRERAVEPDSPASKAGVREGDIILELDGEKISKDNALAKILLKKKPQDTVTLKILREGKELVLQAVLVERPQ